MISQTQSLQTQPTRSDADSLGVLVVAARPVTRSTLIGLLHGFGCRIHEAENAEQAASIHAKNAMDLVLYDANLQVVPALRCAAAWQPVCIAVANSKPDSGIDGWDTPDEWFIRPLQVEGLRQRLDQLFSEISARRALNEAEQLLQDLAETVENRVPGMYQHCRRVAQLALALGQKLGLSREDLWALQRGAFLHDIGKVFIPPDLLYKPGLLTREERKLIEQHVIDGEQICRPLQALAPVLPVIRCHHERFDGGGYPDKRRGQLIPLLARVIQVADIYDVLTHARPYRSALPPEGAKSILLEEVSLGWRDPEIVHPFLAVLGNTHPGSSVTV